MNDCITVLYPVTDLASDGAQRQLLELVKGLDKQRFKPIVLTLRKGGAMEGDFKKVQGLQLICLERKGKYDLVYPLRISRLLRQMKVDVIQPFLTPATFFGLLAAQLSRTPVKIVTERLAAGKRKLPPGYQLYLKAEDTLSHFADWAISNSGAGKDYLIKRGIDPRRVMVIYNGVDLNRLSTSRQRVEEVRQRLGLDSTGKVVGIMARLHPQKDHATFLRAAAIISQTTPDTRFAIVGDGPMRQQLESLSHELGLDSKVVFFGEQRDVGTYLSAFDVAVLTSSAEGCSNSLLEAMAVGKPVVANNVGGNRELVHPGETGFLVPFGDARKLADTIIKLIRDSDTAAAVGQKARDMVLTQFSVTRMVQQYQTIYEDTLRKKTGRRNSSH